jgi:hypothetical protein
MEKGIQVGEGKTMENGINDGEREEMERGRIWRREGDGERTEI